MKILENFQPKLLAVALMIELCTFNSSAFAAAGDGSGGTGGSGTGGSGSGEVLGDLVVLLRDPGGIPILTVEKCQQPLAADGAVIPVDPLTCAVVAGNETRLQAVDFARMSVARSPAKVMDKQMADVLVNLSTAQCLTLDPAGRLVYSSPDTADVDLDGNTDELLSSAVDSPLQNLAIYRELMTKGLLGTPAIALPNPFSQYGILDTAAKALGAASDKGGKINIDLVVYLNQILGLDQLPQEQLAVSKIPLTIRQEVQGQVVEVTKYFLDYSAYNYERAETYGNLPFPKNIPAKNPQLGYFDYLTPYSSLTATDGRPLFNISSANIVSTVFVSLPIMHNIGAFAQASDDARAVIDFMHSHPVMTGYEAPVLCEGSVAPPPLPAVDVSSKLQMPTRMAGNTTREGTLTVSNLKGAPASGSALLVGKDSTGKELFAQYNFNALAAGKSVSFIFPFKAPNYATTITWTATATAVGDNNVTNNVATFKTTVTAPRGGGRGERD
jgi:hypothetical protein